MSATRPIVFMLGVAEQLAVVRPVQKCNSLSHFLAAGRPEGSI